MKQPIRISAVLIISAALVACSAPIGAPGDAVPPVASAEPSFDPGTELSPAPSATGSASSSPSSPSPEAIPSPDPTPVPSPTGTTIVRAYFILDGPVGSAGLVPVLREIPATKAVARAAMNALLAGPNPDERGGSDTMRSAVPDGTRLLGLSIKSGVATVDLSGEFESGGGSASCLGRLGQVVYTLTQFGSVDSVALRVDGQPVSVFGCERIVLDGPVGRETDALGQTMFESVLPAIFVDGPAFGAALGNSGRVTGTANTYEGWYLVVLFDSSGRRLAESVGTATCANGCRGTFEIPIPYALSEPGWGLLRVLDADESGMTGGVAREYRVWLTAGRPVEPEHTCGC
jgi:germination protein M